jgi:Bacterial Ig domain
MSGTHRRDVQRAVLNRRVVGAGVAGVAAVFAVAPFAHADPTGADSSNAPSAPSAAASPSAPGAPKHAQAKVEPKALPSGSTTSTEQPVQPNFGQQKIRVGVQIKTGAWVPDGTNTGGSKITIVETGPNAADAAADNGTSCETVVGSEEAGSSETICQFPHQNNLDQAGTRALAADPSFDYRAYAGDTVTFTQTTVNDNLVIDPVPQTVGPCVNEPPAIPTIAKARAADAADFPTCTDVDTPVEVTFNDAGLPPKAINDTATTASGKSIDIDVIVNDSTKGAPTTVATASDPAHGTAKVLPTAAPAAANARAVSAVIAKIRYTPDAGFSGTDSFKYTITTPNGSSTATVTVTVPAALATETPTPDPTSTAATAPIASTGAPTESIIELGGLLLAVGGAATVLGRRRYIARHVGRS